MTGTEQQFTMPYDSQWPGLANYGEPQSLDHETGEIRWIQTDEMSPKNRTTS